MEVVDVDRFLDGRMPCSSVAPWTMPPFTPPPASQELNAQWWCSRPGLSAVLLNGVRPNSVVQTTSVSSSSPAPLQVREQAGDRADRRSRQPAVVGHVAVRVPVARSTRCRSARRSARRARPAGGRPGTASRSRRSGRAPGRRAPSVASVSFDRSNAAGISAACRRPSRTTGSARPGSGRRRGRRGARR